MLQRRSTKLRPALPPLTPTIPEPIFDRTLPEVSAEVAQLRREVTGYKAVIKAERKKFARLSTAMLRYQSLLEKQVENFDEVRRLYISALADHMVPTRGETR
jgi:hypothetical protein